MKYSITTFSVIFLTFLFINCNDNPVDNSSEEISKEGILTYSIDEYDNFPSPNPKLQVIYKNLDRELVVDTVRVPWEKSFEYKYTTVEDSLRDFNANMIVQYNGEENAALVARISTDYRVEESRIGNSFTVNLKNTFQYPQ